MPRICRLLLLLQILLPAAWPALAAPASTPARAEGSAAAEADPAALPPELQRELERLIPQAWSLTATVRGSAGWRDNVLLSPFAPIARAFGRGELETMLWRPARAQWEFLGFINGDVLRYLSPPPEIGGEQQWSGHGEARWRPASPLRLSLKATGYLRDTVVDLSETERTRVVIPTRVRGANATFAVRWNLPAGFTLEPMAQGRRTTYRDYPGEYEEGRGGARLEWRHSDLLAVSAFWAGMQRDYAEREQFSASGRALPGTRLSFHQREAELRAQSRGEAGGRWSATIAVGRVENRDRASGYFDYDQKRARAELEWQPARWRLLLAADARRMDYLGQTVGAGIAPPARLADDYEATGRIERELRANWTAFLEHRWERSRSNEPGFSYRANTTLAGVQRSF